MVKSEKCNQTCINHNAHNGLCVPDGAPSEQYIFFTETHAFFVGMFSARKTAYYF